MKTPTFWYKPAGLTALLLQPVATIYRAVSSLRGLFIVPYRAQLPLICLGNIVAGGAGKTPSALALAELLKQQGAKPVFVTRGYGGRERGPVLVDLTRHTARDVGDEALLLARAAPVWVGRDRPAAIRAAEQQGGTHILLDDGLQNPSILPDIAFLVIDGDSGLGNGCLIPAGPLRESLDAAIRRITAVILVGARDEQRIADRVQCPVFRAAWQAHLPDDFPRTQKFFAFAGIGRPEKFYQTARASGLDLVGTENFPDHYEFSRDDLDKLQHRAAAMNAELLTTEKDWVRLPENWQKEIRPFPVKLTFNNTEQLVQLLKST